MRDILLEQILKTLQSIEGMLNDFLRAVGVGFHAFGRAYRDIRHSRKKRGSGGSHNRAQWKALKAFYDFTCLRCGRRVPEIKLTKDHIRPLARGGTDFIENIQPLCVECGNLKSDATIDYRQDPIAVEAMRRAKEEGR